MYFLHYSYKSAGLSVTSVGYHKVKTNGPQKLPTWWGAGLCIDPVTNETFIGGADSIPVPIWPKDVPLPSASEEWAKKQHAMQAVKRKVVEVARGEAPEALKMKYPISRKAASEGSCTPKKILVTKAGSSSQQDAQKKRAVEGVKRKIAGEASQATLGSVSTRNAVKAANEGTFKPKRAYNIKAPTTGASQTTKPKDIA